MVFNRYNFLASTGRVLLSAITIALLAVSSTATADTLSSGYTQQPINVSPDGQFTANNGQIYFWNSGIGYQIYNTTTGSTSVIGKPAYQTNSNGYGDAFGVLDPSNSLFYAGTLNNNSASVYEFQWHEYCRKLDQLDHRRALLPAPTVPKFTAVNFMFPAAAPRAMDREPILTFSLRAQFPVVPSPKP